MRRRVDKVDFVLAAPVETLSVSQTLSKRVNSSDKRSHQCK